MLCKMHCTLFSVCRGIFTNVKGIRSMFRSYRLTGMHSLLNRIECGKTNRSTITLDAHICVPCLHHSGNGVCAHASGPLAQPFPYDAIRVFSMEFCRRCTLARTAAPLLGLFSAHWWTAEFSIFNRTLARVPCAEQRQSDAMSPRFILIRFLCDRRATFKFSVYLSLFEDEHYCMRCVVWLRTIILPADDSDLSTIVCIRESFGGRNGFVCILSSDIRTLCSNQNGLYSLAVCFNKSRQLRHLFLYQTPSNAIWEATLYS